MAGRGRRDRGVLWPGADDRRLSAASVDARHRFRARGRFIPRGVSPGRPHRAARRRSAIDDVEFTDFLDRYFRHRGACHDELASAAQCRRMVFGSRRQRHHSERDIDAVCFDQPDRAVPHRADHESRAAVGEPAQCAAARRNHHAPCRRWAAPSCSALWSPFNCGADARHPAYIIDKAQVGRRQWSKRQTRRQRMANSRAGGSSAAAAASRRGGNF